MWYFSIMLLFMHFHVFTSTSVRKILIHLGLDSGNVPLRFLVQFLQWLQFVKSSRNRMWLYWASVWRTVLAGILYARLNADQQSIILYSEVCWQKQNYFFSSFFPSPEIFCHSDCICLQTCQTQWAARANRIWQNPPSCWAQAVAWRPKARSTWTSSDSSLVADAELYDTLIMIANSLCKYFS